MSDRDPTGEAFRQFQYPTLPLHVHDGHIEHAWAAANERITTRVEQIGR